MNAGTPHMSRHTLRRVALLSSFAVMFGAAGCSATQNEGSSNGDGNCSGKPAKKVTIAYQPGLGYAPLLVAKRQKTLEKALPGIKIEWRELNSGAAIRDGIVSGNIQVGSGGIGPILVGVDSGVDEKVITGLNDMSLWLMAKKPGLKTVKDLRNAGKIAMPGPDSIQAVVLKKAAEVKLGDAKALDSKIVAMGHPDGVQALLGGQIAAHLTSPPFQEEEESQGAHKIITSYQLFGEHTFNSVFAKTDFASCNPKVVDALVSSVQAANKLLTNSPKKAAGVLSKEMGIPAAKVEKQITAEDVKFTSTPKGFGKFGKFMAQVGMIKKAPDASNLFFKNTATKHAS